MYIKNRQNSAKFKPCSSYQTLCLTESSVLRNRLLFLVCQEVATALNWLHAVIKMMVGPQELLYKTMLKPPKGAVPIDRDGAERLGESSP
jgi:hypothetical protein